MIETNNLLKIQSKDCLPVRSFYVEQEKTNEFNVRNQLSFKGSEYLKGLVLAKNPFSKQVQKTKNSELASSDDIEKIKTLIKNRNIRDVDYETNRVLSSVRTKKQAQVAIAALQKEVNGKLIYSTYQVSEFVCQAKDEQLADVALFAIVSSDVELFDGILKPLNVLRNDYPKKYVCLFESGVLISYLNKSVRRAENKNQNNLIFTQDVEQFPQIERVCNYIRNDLEQDKTFNILADLYFKDEKAFELVMNSPNLRDKYIGSLAALDSIDLLDFNSLVEIEKAYKAGTGSNSFLRDYVRDSDYFEKQEQLSEYISQFKIDGDITVYRADKGTGSFANVVLENDTLERKIRNIVKLNYFKTKQDMIITPSGKFSTYGEKAVSLYDYINSKDNLTLADAMLVAKYGDKNYIKQITDLIERSVVIDNRFKSTSLSETFVDCWCKDSNNKNSAKIKTKMHVLEGTECVYDSDNNYQAEFILNNTDKRITYQKASYDRKSNTFVLEATVKNI